MAHESQERYSELVLAKLRNELVLKDGVVFNNDYDGDPAAGAVYARAHAVYRTLYPALREAFAQLGDRAFDA